MPEDSAFYDEPSPIPMSMGPVFMASYESDCPSCDEPILPGEDIRADGRGGYIHADTMCEKVSREGGLSSPRKILGPGACPRCFCHHAGEC
jgi:hypothetical protein